MNRQEVNKRIDEYRRIRPDTASNEPSLAEAAMFVEEVFGLTLADHEINTDNLGNIPAIERFVLRKLELDC